MDPSDLLATPATRDWDDGIEGTVRFAVIGVGGFARGVALPALAAADYCTPTVLVSGSDPTAVAEEHGATVVGYDAYHDGAASEDYDAVYVATPNAHHREAVETAARLGKDVVCEKPLADTIADAAAMVATCEEAGVALMTAYRMQCDPVFRRLREGLRAGVIGDVLRCAGGFTFPVLGGSAGPDQWRLDPDLAGGGALFDVGVYPLNTARFLLDTDPEAVTATARGEDPFTAPYADGNTYRGADGSIAFTVEFPDVLGSFTAGFAGHADSRLAVHGTEGRIEVENAFVPGAGRRVIVDTPDGRFVGEHPGGDEVREEFDYFAQALLADDPAAIEPDGADGLTDVRAMVGAYESAVTGERVML